MASSVLSVSRIRFPESAAVILIKGKPLIDHRRKCLFMLGALRTFTVVVQRTVDTGRISYVLSSLILHYGNRSTTGSSHTPSLIN